MKILHITSAYEPAWHLGGVVRAVSQLCRGLVKLGHDVTVYTTDSGLDHRMVLDQNHLVEVRGVKVFYFKTDFLLKFFYSKALGRACFNSMRDFDIVHISAPWAYPGIIAGLAARKTQVPYVISPHGSLIIRYNARKFLKKWAYLHLFEGRNYRHASAIHFTAQLEREQSDPIGRQSPGFIVPNGVDITEFSNLSDKNWARQELGFPADATIVLYFGRIEPRKGLDILIKAFAQARGAAPGNTLLVVAGPDFGEQSSLQELAGQLGIADQVIFPGFIPPEKRTAFLATADIMALVSHPGENFGISALEGMLAGMPVLLSTNVGFYPEVLADKGGMASPLDVEAVSQNLAQMLSDPGNLKTMGENAYRSSRARYDINLVAQKMLMAYEDILTGRRSPDLAWS